MRGSYFVGGTDGPGDAMDGTVEGPLGDFSGYVGPTLGVVVVHN